ncbi:MAG: DEAD/DEAH box helicase, partial [Geminicoccaceae bacterium]
MATATQTSARQTSAPANGKALDDRFARWFQQRGWSPHPHQLEMLAKAEEGRSVLLIAPTGGGKTLAGFLPTLIALQRRRPQHGQGTRGRAGQEQAAARRGLHTLYISPLKALTTDIARNLRAPIDEMELAIRCETRTGDTPQNRRQRQRQN